MSGSAAASRSCIAAAWSRCTSAIADAMAMASTVQVKTTQPSSEATSEQTTSTEDAVSGSPCRTVSSTGTWIAASCYRNFFRNYFGNASSVGVRNTGLDALRNLDRVAVGHWLAYSVWNQLGTAFFNNLAGRVGVRYALLLADPVANRVANIFNSLFANDSAGLVANGLLTAFGNQLASGVGNNLAAWLTNPIANRVGNVLRSAFRNQLASCVSNRLLTALRNQLADIVRNRLATAFWDALGHGVWNNLGQAFGFILHAIDGLFFAGWNPDLLCDCLRRALDALGAYFAWAVDISASRRVEGPCAWFANGSTNNWPSNFFFDGLPASTLNRNGLGEIDWLGDRVVDRSLTGFCDRHINRVVDHLLFGFQNLVEDGVVHYLFVGFTNRSGYRVVHSLGTCFSNRTANCVVDDFFVGFTNWHHHRVIHDFAMRLEHWPRDVVRHLLGSGFINRSAYRVVANASVSFTNRYIDRIRNLSLMGFSLVPNALNLLVFVHDLADQLGAGNRFWFVYDFLDCLGRGVGRWTTWIHNVTTTILVADRAAVSSLSSPSIECGQKSRKSWQC